MASDTVFSDTVAWGGGAICAQIFVGRQTRYIHIYGMKSDAEFVVCLNDEIRKRGAMDKIITNRAQAEVSNKVKDVIRAYMIDDWQTEPHQQQQNYSERVYQDVKKNKIGSSTGRVHHPRHGCGPLNMLLTS